MQKKGSANLILDLHHLCGILCLCLSKILNVLSFLFQGVCPNVGSALNVPKKNSSELVQFFINKIKDEDAEFV